MQALQRCGAKHTAPTIGACCGHLLDDMKQETCEDACNCARGHSQRNIKSATKANNGIACGTNWQIAEQTKTRQQKLAMYMTHMLTAAQALPAHEAHLQQLFDTIQSSHNDVEASKSALLHPVNYPAGCGSPPQELHTCVIQLTAEFPDPGVGGGEEEEENTSRTVKERETDQAPRRAAKG